MLLFLQFDNSILSKSGVKQPISSFCIFCSLRYQLFWNQYFSFDRLHFSLERQSVVLLWAHVSAQFVDYPICNTNNCWGSVDAHFHDGVTRMSGTDSVDKAARTSYMNYCHNTTLRLAMMQYQQSVMLHWRSLSACGRERNASVFAPKDGQ